MANSTNECGDAVNKPEGDASEQERFTDFARRLFAVPKDEYDKEAEAVKQGKPLKDPFKKKPAKAAS